MSVDHTPPEPAGDPAPPDQPGKKRTRNNGATQTQATEGWRSRLAIFVVAFLVIEGVTGLWIYLAPFSILAQIQVLVHTVLGLVLLLPYLYYQVRHFLVWYRQTVTATMVLGYALFAAVIVCSVSAIPLTWQAAFGSRLHATWDLVHLVSGIAATALVVVHVVFAFWRRRMAARQVPDLSRAMRRFAWGNVLLLALVAGVIAGTAVGTPAQRVEFPLPEGYSLPSYVQDYEEYRGKPFAPSYARTASLQLIEPSVLANSASCGTSGCHEAILKEWEPSAHRFAAINPPFQQVQRDFAGSREAPETRYCAGCHDPISLFAGAKDFTNESLSAPGVEEGVSCTVCHSISEVDQRGNADYVLTAPQKYMWESTEGGTKFVSDFLIRAYPRQHLADYDRNLLRTPEFCGVCHKQFIPEALNRFGLTVGQNQYDEWRNSHWHTDDPATDLSCRDCHMRLVRDSRDPGRGEAGDQRRTPDDDTHRHHGTIAANSFMPAVLKLPNWERHVELTDEWLRGETVLPEISDVWPPGPVASVEVHAPETAAPGDTVSVRVLVTNRKAGHNFVTGPLDFIRAWIHLTLTDEAGNVLAEWGGIDPVTRSIMDVEGDIHQTGGGDAPETLVLEAIPVNSKGEPLREHQLWEKAGGTAQRVIFPRYSDAQIYEVVIPEDVRGPVTIRAELNYRRYRQEFLTLVVPTMEEDSGVYQPTVTQHAAAAIVMVRERELAEEQGQATQASGE